MSLVAWECPVCGEKNSGSQEKCGNCHPITPQKEAEPKRSHHKKDK